MNTARTLCAAFCASLSLPGIAAELAGPVQVKLQACAAEADDRLRLACFDQVAAKLAIPTQQPDTAVVDEEFGVQGSVLAKAKQDAQASGPSSVKATVIQITDSANGGLAFHLDNGQVWAQKLADQNFLIRASEQVIIKRAALGSYRLVTAAGRSTRVTRVQ